MELIISRGQENKIEDFGDRVLITTDANTSLKFKTTETLRSMMESGIERLEFYIMDSEIYSMDNKLMECDYIHGTSYLTYESKNQSNNEKQVLLRLESPNWNDLILMEQG
jgi:hypothetical protein